MAVLIPLPRIHRHRYCDVLAPNLAFRASVTAMAAQSLANGIIEVPVENKKDEEIEKSTENKTKRPPNRYLGFGSKRSPISPIYGVVWAMLLVRIYILFPLLCSDCGIEMKITAVIHDKPDINKILQSVGEPNELPALSPAREPPSWDGYSQEMPNDVDRQSI